MRNVLKILLALLTLFCVERFCRYQTDGFRVEKTLGEEWKEPPVALEGHILQLLDQPFTFLGSGVQSYVFLAADGKHVLKLFKHYHMAPRTDLLKKVPLPFWLEGLRFRVLEQRAKRMRSIFESHQIAFEDLRAETGLVHLQLTPSNAPKIAVLDKIGIRRELDLSAMPFALQKRATLVFESLSDKEMAKQRIDSLLAAIKTRCQKGIANSDPIIHRNFGFIGTQAVEIDAGSFAKNPHQLTENELRREIYFETLELQEWMKEKNPELASYLEDKILHENY